MNDVFETNHELNRKLYYDRPKTDKSRQRASVSPVAPILLQPGQVVKFYNDRYWWTVRAANATHAVLTRKAAFNRDSLYTIIAWQEGRRGPHNSWGDGVVTDADAAAVLASLTSGELSLSERRAIHLDFEKMKP